MSVAASSRSLVPTRTTALAWFALLVATVPQVALDPDMGVDAVSGAVLVALVAVVGLESSLRRLRPFLVTLVALQAGLLVADAIQAIPAIDHWIDRAPDYEYVALSAALYVPTGLAMLAAALACGFGRNELFLRVGKLSARGLVPWTRTYVSWSRLGPALLLVLAIPLAIQLHFTVGPHFGRVGHLLPWLPLALAFGAVNAAQEELRFRAVPLATLQPVVGSEAALWMTAVVFGLAHWHGHPSGPSGVVLAGLAGLAWGKAMLETRGFFWAWATHAAMDVLIFAFLVLAA